MGRGKYQFVDEYSYLEVPEANWFRMTREQRKKHLDKVSKTQLDSDDTDCSQLTASSLNITPSIQGIWKKVDELITQPNAIVPAPGFPPGSKMVASMVWLRLHKHMTMNRKLTIQSLNQKRMNDGNKKT